MPTKADLIRMIDGLEVRIRALEGADAAPARDDLSPVIDRALRLAAGRARGTQRQEASWVLAFIAFIWLATRLENLERNNRSLNARLRRLEHAQRRYGAISRTKAVIGHRRVAGCGKSFNGAPSSV